MIELIYQDSSILVINKAAGVISIADGYSKNIPHLRTILEPEFGRLWVVHRLDKETSGVMILARTAEAHRDICQQFSTHTVKKEYSALVYGSFPKNLVVNFPLLVNGDRRHRTIVNEVRGKPARTEFLLQKSFPTNSALISAVPHTGYSHQIRAHLLNASFPILGDPLYANQESKSYSTLHGIHRVALHASQITFLHPESHEQVNFKSDFPDDFLEMISNCEKLNGYQITI